ncbi:MAG: hypothetical protein LBQ15_02090 [Clostridium sp.]|jgi:phosphotransferase system HPr-like phosphotransfer protein|nr:hypothetical protein [Clostridium sp.]
MADKNGISILIAFVERGQGKSVSRIFLENQISISFQCLGSGTASSELMDVLGLGTSEKDILLGLASGTTAERFMRKLAQDSGASPETHGILFDMKLTGLNSRIATLLLHTGAEGHGGATMEQDHTRNSLILVTVNHGFTDEVMDTARAAGARGGTIVQARWTGGGGKEPEHFYGIHVQAEKEIIAIVAPTENRNIIMETINRKHGLNTKAAAMICSLGIDHLVRL